jgi:hypothetical protein
MRIQLDCFTQMKSLLLILKGDFGPSLMDGNRNTQLKMQLT